MRSTLTPAPLDVLPMVGRDDALDRLGALLRAAENRSAAAALVVGEAGIGKSRIVAELADIARERGFRVAAGVANAVERNLSYSLVADMFTPLIAALDPGVLDRMTRGRASALASIFPAIERSPRDRYDAADAGEDRTRAFWAAGQLLTALAERAPLLLVADNLQWSDRASLELLHFLARSASGRVLFVGTWTTDEPSSATSWATAQRSALSLGVAEIVRLAPLSLADVGTLVCATFDVTASAIAPFVSLLYGWTRGNPLFVREVLRTLIDSGELYVRNGVWHGWSVGQLVLPRTIRDTFGGRLATLTHDARVAAGVIAVSGTPIPHERLARAADLDDAALLTSLDELRRRGMLTETADGEVRYDLTHPLLRDVVIADLGPARVRRLHLAIADATLDAASPAGGVRAEEIASHVLHADATTGRTRFVPAFVAAGESALARNATADAARYLDAALDALPDDDPDVERLLGALARARQRNGEYDEAVRLWTVLRDRARAREPRRRCPCHLLSRAGAALARGPRCGRMRARRGAAVRNR